MNAVSEAIVLLSTFTEHDREISINDQPISINDQNQH